MKPIYVRFSIFVGENNPRAQHHVQAIIYVKGYSSGQPITEFYEVLISINRVGHLESYLLTRVIISIFRSPYCQVYSPYLRCLSLLLVHIFVKTLKIECRRRGGLGFDNFI